MRSAPAVRAVVHNAGVWRASVAGWSVVSGGIGVWWLISVRHVLHPALVAALAIVVLVCVVSAMTTTLGAPRLLHWDGQLWRLHGAASDDVREGRIAAAIDLGGWMLLRFDADSDGAATRRWRVPAHRGWLPVQRRGLERDWHALRCAVHAPPAPGSTT